MLASIMAALTLVGCGGAPAASSGRPSSSPEGARASTVAGLTCADIQPDLQQVIHDLRVQGRHYQEAWVSGGDSSDLQALIGDTQNSASGTNQLSVDASTFNQDATSYLNANSPYLAPGWQQGYSNVTNDVNALASDCGTRGAPVNTPGNS
jgi:hypothetical protein